MNERSAALDAARGALMLLGILFHATEVYANHPWRIHDPAGGVTFDWIEMSIHGFRMQAFFWISGYFTARGVDRLPPLRYLAQRSQRLLVPFVATLLTFNVGQIRIEELHGDPAQPGEYVGHLWFLLTLWLLTAFCVFTYRRDGRLAARSEIVCSGLPGTFGLLLGLTLFSVSLQLGLAVWIRTTGLGAFNHFGVSAEGLLLHGPFFLFGMLAARSEGIRENFARVQPGWMLVSIPANGWLALHPDVLPHWWMVVCVQSFLTWVTVAAVITFCTRALARPNAATRWMADAAYPVYLSHQFFVVAGGALLLAVPIPHWMKFLVLVAVTLTLSAGFAWMVHRVPLLQWPYAGGRIRRPPNAMR